MQEAIQTNNPSLCDKLPSAIPDIQPRQDCYYAVAIETHNPSLCEKGHGYFCYLGMMARYQDVSICDYLQEQEKQYNVRGPQSTTTNNPDGSITINNNYAKIISDKCYTEYGKITNSSLVCQKIIDKNLQISCYVKLDGPTPELCSSQELEVHKSYCYYLLSLKEKDTSWCSYTTQSSYHDLCINGIAP